MGQVHVRGIGQDARALRLLIGAPPLLGFLLRHRPRQARFFDCHKIRNNSKDHHRARSYANAGHDLQSTFDEMQAFDRFADLEQRQVGKHCLRGLVTPARISLTCPDDDFVEFQETISVSKVREKCGRFWKTMTVFAGGYLI